MAGKRYGFEADAIGPGLLDRVRDDWRALRPLVTWVATHAQTNAQHVHAGVVDPLRLTVVVHREPTDRVTDRLVPVAGRGICSVAATEKWLPVGEKSTPCSCAMRRGWSVAQGLAKRL